VPDAKKLARIQRVRTLQLGLVRADEMRAHEKHASETSLHNRIRALADAVAPAPDTRVSAASMGAQAHFRERLHQSAAAAQARVDTAELMVNRAAEATRSAKRDQSAIEKLLERARRTALAKEMRALEETPPVSPLKAKRHDPC
jgi:flagellar protein FliJ